MIKKIWNSLIIIIILLAIVLLLLFVSNRSLARRDEQVQGLIQEKYIQHEVVNYA